MEALPGSMENPDLSSILSSCEPELQELMRQIDIMINHQKKEWETATQAQELKLKSVEKELLTSNDIIKRRELEIELLRKQLETTKQKPQDLVSKYEQQLGKVREELEKLKRSYQKLQHKHFKQSLAGTKENDHYKLQLRDDGEHRKEVLHLRTELQKAQEAMRLHKLELERTRMLKTQLAQHYGDHRNQGEFWCSSNSQHKPCLDQMLLNNSARLRQALQAKDQVIRSLEDCLAAQGCGDVESLRQELEKTATKLQTAQACEIHLKTELASVKEKLEKLSIERRENFKTEEELKRLKAEYDSATAEVEKVKDELQKAREAHSGELEAMRKEVSKLADELHQRDIAFATLSSSSASIRQQLHEEKERAEHNIAKLKMTQSLLETLQTENQHLKTFLQSQPLPSPQRPEVSAAPLKENYISPLQNLEMENQQLRHALSRMQTADTENSTTPSTSSSKPKSTNSYEGQIKRLFTELQTSSLPKESCGEAQSVPHSPYSSLSGLVSERLTRRHSLPRSTSSESVADGQTSCSEASLNMSCEEKAAPSSSSSEGAVSPARSPGRSVLAQFLHEEKMQSDELLQKLDGHIQGMSENIIHTVVRCLEAGPGFTAN